MARNITADIEAGYSPNDHSIVRQFRELQNYKQKFDDELAELIICKNEKERNRWCYRDMKKRGAI